MHIVFVDTTLSTPPTGGGQTFLVTVASELVRAGHRITVITQPGSCHSVMQALIAAGVTVLDRLWGAWHVPEARAKRLSQWVNSANVDVYVVSISPDVGWLALPLLDSRVGTVSIAHNDVEAFYAPLRYYGEFIDSAIGVSCETARKIKAECGIAPEKCRNIPYGVYGTTLDGVKAKAHSSSNLIRVIYVGRMVQEQKRVFDFVPLALELERRGIGFELHLVGDGLNKQGLMQQFRQSGVLDRVRFHGWLDSDGVRDRLSKCDAFVLLSEYEGLPVSLLEAMSHGVAPVVTRTASGSSQIIENGINGFIANPGDIETLAAGLGELAGNKNKLVEMQKAAWLSVQQFSVHTMVNRYLECFRGVSTSAMSRRGLHAAGSLAPMPSCRSRYPLWLRQVKYMASAIGRTK